MRDYRAEAEKAREVMEEKISIFKNFTNEDFTGYWDGRPHYFKAGSSKHIQDFKAQHFAKALVNRELLRKKLNKNGEILRDLQGHPVYVIKDGDRYVSPKVPEDVPIFYNLFKKAYIKENDEAENPENFLNKDVSSELGIPKRERKSEIREKENKEKLGQKEEANPKFADLPVDDEEEFEENPNN